MKKIKSLALAACLLFALFIPVFASCEDGTVPVGGRSCFANPDETEQVIKDSVRTERVDKEPVVTWLDFIFRLFKPF